MVDFLVGLIATLAISALVTRPIAQIVETAEAIALGDWEHRAPVASNDEAGQLASSFNLMLDRLAAARAADPVARAGDPGAQATRAGRSGGPGDPEGGKSATARLTQQLLAFAASRSSSPGS